MYIILKKYGFEPSIISTQLKFTNISFLKKYTNVRIIKSFSEIREEDYNLLMVNSDQTWRYWDKKFYDIAFLKFAEKWNIPKFIYGTSIGFNKWDFTNKDEKLAKYLLKNFTGISVREANLSKLIKEHLGMNSHFVLDPTLLIEKKYYLNIIKDYKSHINIRKNYIFVYNIYFKHIQRKQMYEFINEASKKLNYSIFNVNCYEKEYIEKFLYGIKNSNAVITDSFHGTIFSIIFNKPFISFMIKNDERFNNLKEIFDLKNRIIELNECPDINLLKQQLFINKAKLYRLKIKSLKYLKKNLLKD
jgi:polysaccharide pyruvyl transferase WcaK-like protein